MDAHKTLREKLLIIVDQLLAEGGSETAAETYERLQAEGFDSDAARTLIAQCVGIEFLDGSEDPADFDPDRFERNLNKLPKPPYEEESDELYGDGEEEGGMYRSDFDDF